MASWRCRPAARAMPTPSAGFEAPGDPRESSPVGQLADDLDERLDVVDGRLLEERVVPPKALSPRPTPVTPSCLAAAAASFARLSARSQGCWSGGEGQEGSECGARPERQSGSEGGGQTRATGRGKPGARSSESGPYVASPLSLKRASLATRCSSGC